MKNKILYLFFLFMLSGCGTPELKENEVRINGSAWWVYEVNKFEFEGHEYLLLTDGTAQGVSGMVHDPNCKCSR